MIVVIYSMRDPVLGIPVACLLVVAFIGFVIKKFFDLVAWVFRQPTIWGLRLWVS